MKSIKIICCFIVICNGFIYGQRNQTLYAAALNGLSLREEPNKESKRLELIPYGTILENIGKDEYGLLQTFNNEIIDGYNSSWIKISYNNQTGYVFQGFTIPLAPPDQSDLNLSNYFKRIWNKPVLSDSFPNTYRSDNDGKYGMNYRNLFKTGEIFLTASMEEAWEYSFIDLNLSVEQAYLWFYLLEEKLMDKTHILPKMSYPSIDIKNDSLMVKHRNDFDSRMGTELDIRSIHEYTYYVRFIGQNNRLTIICGGYM